MDIFIVLKTISFLATLGVIIYGWKIMSTRSIRALFAAMLVFFFLSTILFAKDSMLDTWLKHIVFFIGQFLFYIFLTAVIAFHTKKSAGASSWGTGEKSFLAGMAGIPLAMQSEAMDWIEFITDQGVQHILALPLFFLIIATIELRYFFITSPAFRSLLNMFMFAAGSLVMIHAMEFIVESQGFIPALEGDPIEIMEFGWFYLGLFFFARAVFLMKNIPGPEAPQSNAANGAL